MAQQIGVNGNHDLGGIDLKEEGGLDPELLTKIDRTEKPNTYWETSIHALLVVLSTKKPKSLASTDELRRCVEALEPEAYKTWGYYDKWSVALTILLTERGVITHDEVDAELNGDSSVVAEEIAPIYKVGDVLRVKTEDSRLRWRRPHIRCPGYIYGQTAIVEEYVGAFKDPFLLAFRAAGPKQHLYRVSFDLAALWDNTGAAKDQASVPSGSDRIQADIYEGWLEPLPEAHHEHSEACQHHHEHAVGEGHSHDHGACDGAHHHDHQDQKDHAEGGDHSHGHHHGHEHKHEHKHKHDHGHDHGHAHAHVHTAEPAAATTSATTPASASATTAPADHAHTHTHEADADAAHTHDHGHTHEGRYEVECTAVDREGADSDRPGKVVGEALLRLLYRKGVVTPAELHRAIEGLEMANVSMKAADLVVYAWKDSAFKERLVKDAPAAAMEYNMATSNQNAPTILRVVANTPTIHNVIVCTLCSCYPIGLLGFSPAWYKSRAYRSRVVREPRKVLEEFGLSLPTTTTVRVHDSTADCRYFVLPLPPARLSEADIQSMSHAELRALITRDSMIGVAVL